MTVIGEGYVHHPLSFDADEVRALLSGRKTMARRRMATRVQHIRTGQAIWVKEAVVMTGKALCPGGYLADGARPRNVGEILIAAEYMPRHVSRLTLEVTAWRMERLRSISAADVLLEGLAPGEGDPCEAFCADWAAKNPAAPSNPVVAVLSFVVKVRNIDQGEPIRAGALHQAPAA